MAAIAPARPTEAVAAPRAAAARRPVAWYAAPVAALLSVAAGYVHLAYVESHWEAWWGYGLFFLATGVGQLAFGPLIMKWPSRPLIALGIVGNLAIVGMWVVSRTEGIPMGTQKDMIERAGAVDVLTSAGEIAIVAALVLMIGAQARRWILNGLLVAGVALWVLRFAGVLN